MLYREVDFRERKPKWSASNYFFETHSAHGNVYEMGRGYTGHMESYMKKHPDHKLTWLEPETEWEEEKNDRKSS